MFLQLLSYVGVTLGFFFLVLSIALGLYYLSELVEEHTEPTRRFLKRLIQGNVVVLLLLWLFDSFPFKLTAFLIVSYIIYMKNLEKFPYVQFTSPIFLVSCVLVVANHFLWFEYFHNPEVPPLEVRLSAEYVPRRVPLFTEVCSFFGLLVWFVPFALFVSLSAHDNLLPQHMENNPEMKKKSNGLAKVVVTKVREYIYAFSRRMGYELDSQYGIIA